MTPLEKSVAYLPKQASLPSARARLSQRRRYSHAFSHANKKRVPSHVSAADDMGVGLVNRSSVLRLLSALC